LKILVLTETKDEVLVYDTERRHIHHLNQVSAVVWRLLDGKRSLEDVTQAAQQQLGTQIDAPTVESALMKLEKADLLEGTLLLERSSLTQSRRSLLRRAAVAGAGATIVSISAPTAAAAVAYGPNPVTNFDGQTPGTSRKNSGKRNSAEDCGTCQIRESNGEAFCDR